MNRHTTSLRLLLGTILAAVVAVAVVPSSPASAHRNDESYLYLDVGDSTLSGRVEMPYRDMREVFDLELTGSPDDLLDELESRLPELQAYADEHTTIGSAGQEWPLTFEGVDLVEELLRDDAGPESFGYVILPFTVGLDTATVPQLIDVTFTPFLAEIDGRDNVVLVSNDWKRGVVEQESNELLVISESSPSGTIDLGDPSQWRNFTASIDLGVDHIRTGPDHIFFVLVLLLPSVLILSLGRWRPATTFHYSLIRVFLVATMFTVAHSITFTLAGLDVLPLPPSKFVETVIALSIAAAALHNLKPIFGHREWLIAFAFGLFHGMGFAGLVEDLDIDRTTQLVSLLGRNAGIEIGQTVIILVTFPMLFLLRRTRVYVPAMYLGSSLLAVLSGMWVIERVFETDLNINGGIDAVLLWPRSFYAMIVLTAIAAAYRQFEASRGRLLPLGDDGEEPAELDDHVDDPSDDDLEAVPV
jgi:hypothetical protein